MNRHDRRKQKKITSTIKQLYYASYEINQEQTSFKNKIIVLKPYEPKE